MYDKYCVTARSMPFWCVQNPLGDPFGGPFQPKQDSLDTAKMLAKAKKAGLIEMTSTHDDDLVPWDPEHPEDDLDPKSAVYAKLRAIKSVLDGAGLKVNMRYRFIKSCSAAVDICVKLAQRLKPVKPGMNHTEAELAAIRQMCRV